MKRVIGRKTSMSPSVSFKEEDFQEKNLERIEKILIASSNISSLKILNAAKDGIENSMRTIEELGLTQKKYYTNLKRLIDAGLIEKVEGAYRLTIIGEYCLKLGNILLNVIRARERIELINELMKSKKLSMDEKERIMNVISDKMSIETINLEGVIHRKISPITDYNQFINEVCNVLNNAKRRIYVATNKSDPRVIDPVLSAIDRDVELFFLSKKKSRFELDIKLLRYILNSNLLKIVYKMMTLKELNFRVVEKLNFSFILADEKHGIIELTKPDSSDFFVAFRFEDPFLYKKLESIFNELYKAGKRDPRIKLFREHLTAHKSDPKIVNN